MLMRKEALVIVCIWLTVPACITTVDGDEVQDRYIAESRHAVGPLVFGETMIDHKWKRVSFGRTISDAVVVTGPLSANGSHPAVVRIRNVDSSGFEIRVQEWRYLDGTHYPEAVSFIAGQRGKHQLGIGMQVELGTLELGLTQKEARFRRHSFDSQFQSAPVVLATLNTFVGSHTVVSRIKDIDSQGFSIGLQEEEASVRFHYKETIGYLAVTPGAVTLDGHRFVAGASDATIPTVNHVPVQLPFSFARTPVFVASMQTTNGSNTANLRWRDKSATGVQVWVSEEQSADEETAHAAEQVGLVAIAKTIGVPLCPAPCPGTPYTPGQKVVSASGLVDYYPGDLPLILVSPHNGQQTGGLPPRSKAKAAQCSSSDVMFTTYPDPGSQKYTREVADTIYQMTGRRPHVVILHLSRSRLDANRNICVAATGNPVAEQVWHEYHDFIAKARRRVANYCGRGFFAALHTMSRSNLSGMINLGYGSLAVDDLTRSDAELNAGDYERRSYIRAVSQRSSASFAELVRGRTSLGGLLQKYNIEAVPSPAYPTCPAGECFNGSLDAAKYGSKWRGTIDGALLEAHQSITKNDVKRSAMSRALAKSLIDFLETHYGFKLRCGTVLVH